MVSSLTLHPDRARSLAYDLLREYEERGIFGHRELPDDLINQFKNSLDEETFLLVITFTVALDYLRPADKLWESSVNTLLDEEVKWVFYPKEVLVRSKDELKEALSKHGLAKKKNKDVEIWYSLAETFSSAYGGSIKKLFSSYDFDVEKMFEDFKIRKKEFPSLSGEKIFPHWIRTLSEKLSLDFKNLERLPIPADVHVVRATFTTGCITGKYSSKGITETLKRKVVEVWNLALKGTEIPPITMFRPLWLLSKYGCHYRKNGDRPKLASCPVSSYCVDGKVIVSSKKVEIDT